LGWNLHPVRSGCPQGLHRQPRNTWQLKWTEYPGNPVFRFQHVHILFETRDFDRPTIRVAVPSRSDGEAWNAKLSILMS
jgi:hypothetical protein